MSKNNKEIKNVTLSLKIPEDLKKWLKKEAIDESRPVSNFVMLILKKYREDIEKKRES